MRLPDVLLTIPLQCCGACTRALGALSALAHVDDGEVMCDRHARATDAGKGPDSACTLCRTVRAVASARAALFVLDAVAHEPFFGDGARHTTAMRSTAAIAAFVPMLALGTLRGVLIGGGGGLLGGAAGGAVVGGALALDANNNAAALSSKPGFFSRWGGKRTSAVTVKPATTAAVGSVDPHRSAEASTTSDSKDDTKAAPAADDRMAAARAVLRLSPEARDADAAAELQRVLACKTAYEILGVPPTATTAEIRSAYRAKSLAYHPDRNGSSRAVEVSQVVNAAWSLLGDDAKRAAYDASGHTDAQGVDFFAGIRVTRGGIAAGVAGGVLGGVLGAGLGLVSGALLGSVSGVVESVRRARDMALVTESARATVAARVEDARSAVLALIASTAHAPGVTAATLAASAAAPRRVAVDAEVISDTNAADGATAARLRLTLTADATASTPLPEPCAIVKQTDASGAPAAGESSRLLGYDRVQPFVQPPLSVDADTVVDDAFISRVVATVPPDDGVWMAAMLRAARDAAAAVRREAGIPEPPGSDTASPSSVNAGEVSGRDYDDPAVAAAAAAAASGGLQTLGVAPPTSAIGLLSVAGKIAGAAREDGDVVASVQGWALLLRLYECWSAGVEVPPELAAARTAAAAAEAHKKGGSTASANAAADADASADGAQPALPQPLALPPLDAKHRFSAAHVRVEITALSNCVDGRALTATSAQSVWFDAAGCAVALPRAKADEAPTVVSIDVPAVLVKRVIDAAAATTVASGSASRATTYTIRVRVWDAIGSPRRVATSTHGGSLLAQKDFAVELPT